MTAAASATTASVAPPPARALRERLLRPTFPELWTFLAVGLPVLASLIAALPTVDLAYQLRAGADILAGRGIPAVDSWTFTAAGEPWLDQQWGAQAILAAVHGVSGWVGLAVFRAVMVGLTFGLILVAVRLRQPRLRGRGAAWLTIGAFVVAAPALALRPQLLAMACFAVTLALLSARRVRPRLVWLVPIVAIGWANLHGSFILAPLLIGLAWLEDIGERAPRADATLAASLVTGAATLVTPFGLDTWRYVVELARSRDVTQRVSEWQPTTPTDVPGLLFWASVVLVVVAVVVLARRAGRPRWSSILGLVAFAGLGAMTVRGIAWWPGLAAVTIAGLLAPPSGADADRAADVAAEPSRGDRGSRLNGILALALAATCLAAIPAWRPTDPGTGAPEGLLSHAPSGITAALRESAGPSDRVWNPQVWGSWFEHAVPAATYAFDARVEIIPSAAWDAHDRVAGAIGDWPGVLDQYGVTIVVSEGSMSTPLARALGTNPGWHLAYTDKDGAIWLRAIEPGSTAAARLSSAP